MFYFAWVDAGTAFDQSLKRHDDVIVGFAIDQQEGGFAGAKIDLKNPHVGLLSAGRKLWAWLSWTDSALGSTTAVPLFFGRLVGVPDAVDREVVTLSFIARPEDFDAQRQTLSETLKVAPYWDPLWISPDQRLIADTVLDSRTALWHIDRTSHVVTLSDTLNGDDGTVDLVAADILDGSLQVAYGQVPLRKVSVTADVIWVQQATGVVDLSALMVAAFKAQGSQEPLMISSYTGQGLSDDWPQPSDDFGGGWAMAQNSSLLNVDGTVLPRAYHTVTVKYDKLPTDSTESVMSFPFDVDFPLWRFKPNFTLAYEAARNRSETVNFILSADVQSLLTEAGDSETLSLSFSSSEATALIDADGTSRPIGDLARSQYLPTDRGQQSLAYLIARARAALLNRARAVDISAAIPFAIAASLTLRKNATLTADQIPGGAAAGKITGYDFALKDGVMSGSVKIGCVIGRGNNVAAIAGSPAYVNDGYVGNGYQTRIGQSVMPIAGEVTYQPITDAVMDDGVDFYNMTPARVVTSLSVSNGVTIQAAALGDNALDITTATEALNAVHTEVDLVLVPVDAGPFTQSYILVVSDVMAPKTLDLEAA